MHPAPSVIIFTVLSGAGFGLLAFLCFGVIAPVGWQAFWYFLAGYALAVGGLLSSTLHLGHPERALLAFTQWRSSWLSREGVAAVLALICVAVYAIGAIFFATHLAFIGLIAGLLCLGTVFTTSMIYTQLKTVPRWNQILTPVMFLLFSLAAGAILTAQTMLAAVLLLALGVVLVAHWVVGDSALAASGSTMQSATRLGDIGTVRLFEAPHTSPNYLMKEMIHVVGRKHAMRLRLLSLLLGCVLPALLLLLLPAHTFVVWIAFMSHIIGAFGARWLFFAEAEHVVGLYYGKR